AHGATAARTAELTAAVAASIEALRGISQEVGDTIEARATGTLRRLGEAEARTGQAFGGQADAAVAALRAAMERLEAEMAARTEAA
ncbi:hypothetical protein, partial [Klebsiella pneumoniae]